MGCLGFLIYKRSGTLGLTFLEREAPIISAPSDQVALGPDTREVEFHFQDSGAGLDEVIVRVEQGGKSQDITHQSFPPGTHDTSIKVALNGKEKGLKEGEATVKVSAFDKSFWNNGAHQSFSTLVDYTKPKIELLTNQHNTGLGGVELAFYRTKGDDIIESGIRVGERVFAGYPAKFLDKEFENFPDVYFAFFALPYDFSRDKDKVLAFAKDKAQNVTSSPLSYLLIPRKYKTVEMKLEDGFLRKVFEELLPAYYKDSGTENSPVDFDTLSDEKKIALFKTLNEDYRKIMIHRSLEVLRISAPQKLWNTPWSRPLAAAPTSTFCETRNYVYKGMPASTSLHAGVDLADVTNSPVKSVNNGKVLFADFLALYGNAVIIDHGFGLATLYGHLSSIAVAQGDEVTKDSVIGRSGSTGLAGGDHLHFEFRLQGAPIHPIEWWDEHWIREHIEKKIQGVKEQLLAQATFDAQLQGK